MLGYFFQETQLRRRQRGNPVLESIRNVGKEFGDIVADYQVGRTTGVLFLRYGLINSNVHSLSSSNSLKYHRLHPEYIHTRIEKLGMSYNLRILLILCDIVRNHSSLFHLSNSPYSQNIGSLYVNLPRLKPTFMILSPLTTN